MTGRRQEAPDHKKTARCGFDFLNFIPDSRVESPHETQMFSAGLIFASVFIFRPSGAFDRQKQTRCWFPESTTLMIGSLTTDQMWVTSRSTFLKVRHRCFWCVREGLEIINSCQSAAKWVSLDSDLVRWFWLSPHVRLLCDVLIHYL